MNLPYGHMVCALLLASAWPRIHPQNASDSEDGRSFSVSIRKVICDRHQGAKDKYMINIPVQNLLNHGTGQLAVPANVELIEDNLVRDINTIRSVIECPQNLLDSFIELADADSETIHNFACRHGLLDLRKEHSLPFHNLSFIYNIWVNPDRSCKPSGAEPIETWRNWARKFQAVLRIVSKLSDRQSGDWGDWDLVLTDIDFGNEPFYWDDEEEEIDTLTDILKEIESMQCLINNYLKLGGIRLWFYLLENEDDEIQPRLTIESSVLSLFAALVLQLVSRISQFAFKKAVEFDLELAS